MRFRRLRQGQHALRPIFEHDLVDRGREDQPGITSDDVDRISSRFVTVALDIGQNPALLVFLHFTPSLRKRFDVLGGCLDDRAEQVFLGVVATDQRIAARRRFFEQGKRAFARIKDTRQSPAFAFRRDWRSVSNTGTAAQIAGRNVLCAEVTEQFDNSHFRAVDNCTTREAFAGIASSANAGTTPKPRSLRGNSDVAAVVFYLAMILNGVVGGLAGVVT